MTAMTPITFWFDPLSPYAWLAFDRLPQALEGCSYVVDYRPVLLGGLLKHWGQLGPAEIAPKRGWTYRHVAWLARQQGTPLQMPAVHPFNPLTLLRLLLACAEDGRPNRAQCEAVFRHVWCHGGAADDPARVATLAAHLAPRRDPAGAAVRQQLRDETDAAIAAGVFGAPTLVLPPADASSVNTGAGAPPAATPAPRLFWGHESLDMVAACLKGDPWFDGPWLAAGALGPGVSRKP